MRRVTVRAAQLNMNQHKYNIRQKVSLPPVKQGFRLSQGQTAQLRKVFLHYSASQAAKYNTFDQVQKENRTMTSAEFKRFVRDFQLAEESNGILQLRKVEKTLKFSQFLQLLYVITKSEVTAKRLLVTEENFLLQKLQLDRQFGWYKRGGVQVVVSDNPRRAFSQVRNRVASGQTPTRVATYLPLERRFRIKSEIPELFDPLNFVTEELTKTDFYLDRIKTQQ